jgi:hypothetical protein
VRHQGRKTLEVRRDDFVKGSPANPWPEVFSAFSDQIAKHVGKQRDLVVCDFSTTGPCERAASEIVLMEAMKHYFSYSCLTTCGIPEIALEGTTADWRSIRRRAQVLEEYDLSWWIRHLLPVLDQLVTTADGQVDARFWQSFFKFESNSMGKDVTGWINVLFPYLRAGGSRPTKRNEALGTWAEGLTGNSLHHRLDVPEIPMGLSLAPFKWTHLGEIFDMKLLGGFVGIAQDPVTLAVRPAIGWGVREAGVPR